MKVRIKSTQKKGRMLFSKDKEYEVIKSGKKSFRVLNDVGMKCLCLWRKCSHIKGDWEVVEEGRA